MAKIEVKIPQDEIRKIEEVYKNTFDIFGRMTRAGAQVTLNTVKSNVPRSWHGSNIMNNIKLTKTYRTPSDGGINTKIIINGYFINKNGVRTPAPLVANVFEHGRSAQSRGGKFVKQPFFRKSFKKDQIEKAMLDEQKKASGGILDE